MATIIGALPVNLLNGTTADAVQVMADFNFIVTQVNANGLARANNLSDVASAATSRTNLGLGAVALLGSSGLLNVRSFTSSGTYTPTAGTARILVQLQAPGGGGGGCAATAGSTIAAGGGGGGGEYKVGFFTSAFSGITMTLPAGGAGGVAGNTAGTAGANALFGALMGAAAGSGGFGGAAVTPPNSSSSPRAGGGGGAGGLYAILGGVGSGGYGLSTTSVVQGTGGCSPFSMSLGIVGAGTGNDAGGPGGGGNGGASGVSQIARAGGDGGSAFCIVWEFSQ